MDNGHNLETEMQNFETTQLTPEGEVLAAYYQLLGFPTQLRQVPEGVTRDQMMMIRELTSDPSSAFATMESLYQEACVIEPAWDNLDPKKRQEVAREGSQQLARAFGHSVVEVSRQPY